ncbi:MAG TPA: response regulator, partial [bacterium]|nr:response regulator [bacterium]
MNPTKTKILVVDDDESIRLSFKLLLERESFQADIVGSGKAALKLLERQGYPLAFVDLMMPELGGMDLLKIIRDNYP